VIGTLSIVTRVGFILRPDRQSPGPLLDELVAHLVLRGDTAVVCAEDEPRPTGAEVVPENSIGASIDLAVALGGDGTVLRACTLVADHGVPVLGINLGYLGFLSPFDPNDAKPALDAALSKQLPIEDRSRMRVKLTMANGEVREHNGLNEAVLHQGTMARLVELVAFVDGQLITEYRADGLIVATPTGSTAYNLAAGGPVIMPGLGALSITPICAHALTNRPLVVSQNQTITIQIPGQVDSHDVVLTVDGTWVQPISPGDRVDISAADRPFRVFVSHKPYFDILREKLHWGVRNE
jgi:NAD+ kinase